MTADNKFEVRSSQFPYNMSGWCTEKSSHLLRELSRIVDAMNRADGLPADFKEEVTEYLGSAVDYAVILLAFSCGRIESVPSGEEIMRNGHLGYELLAVECGLLEMTSEERQRRDAERLLRETHALIQSYAHRLVECLAADRASGRAAAFEILSTCGGISPVFAELADSLERVTMGELPWEDYVESAKSQLQYLLESNFD